MTKDSFTNSFTNLKVVCMDLSKIHIQTIAYFMSFKRLMRDSIGALLIKRWEHTEKDIESIEDNMLPEVLRIQVEGFETRSSDKLIKYSKRLRKIFYVIKSQNQVVGYSIYYLQPVLSFKGLKKKSVICSISIDKNFRVRGFANRLLNESIREMRLNKIASVLLYVNVNNVPAIKLYEKLGFRITKETKNICGQSEKCYEMELNLTCVDVHFQRVLAQR
jgi:[ribosomal protein S18]-alanine N-acetyltransferase